MTGRRVINFEEAAERGWVDEKRAIHTFSNGTEGYGWMDCNCYECAYYDPNGNAGDYCAFESAAFLGMVTPELAQWFGWQRDEKYEDSWDYPRDCPLKRARPEGGDGEFVPPPPPADPDQLVLLADPTEDASIIQNAPVEVEKPVPAFAMRDAGSEKP